MPYSLRSSSLGKAYQELATRWRALDNTVRRALVDGFAVSFAYHLGSLENDQRSCCSATRL